jgi:predicted Zn-dependent peptidase
MLRQVSLILLIAAVISQSCPGIDDPKPAASLPSHERILRLPEAHLRHLPNGMQAVVIRNHGRLTVMQVRVIASSLNDSSGQTGLAEATAQLLVTDDLRQGLEDHGATIEVSTPYGSYNTVFTV